MATQDSEEAAADLISRNSKRVGKPITRKKASEMAGCNTEFSFQYNIETAQQHQAREARSINAFQA